MVVTFLLAPSDNWVWHDRTATPSRWTVQAPHKPAPQPNLVPVMLRFSLMIQSNGVPFGASTATCRPLIVKSVMFPPFGRPLRLVAGSHLFRRRPGQTWPFVDAAP